MENRMFIKKVIAVSLISGLTLVGCDQKKSGSQQKIVITAKAQMEAEELAQAGEQLISPTTFHLAEKVFDMVLVKDPRNKKAQLYKAALKPFTVFKGVLARIRPYVMKHGGPEGIKNYQKLVREDLRQSPLKTWLLNGPEDLTNLEQIQDLMVQSRDAMEAFRKFLKANPNLDLTIYLNEFVHAQALEASRARDCVVLQEGQGIFEVECNTTESAQRKMNSADVVMLQQMVAGWVLYQSFLTNYSLKNYDQALKPLEELQKAQDMGGDRGEIARARQNILENLEGFGKLRKDHNFHLLREMGADLKAAMEWAIRYQSELCPTRKESFENRKGFVFEAGICIADEAVSDLNKTIGYIGQALSGRGVAEIEMEIESSTGKETKRVDLAIFAWSKKPVQDLRSLAPSGFDSCGDSVGLRDKTFGGIFVNGDAETYLVSPCQEKP